MFNKLLHKYIPSKYKELHLRGNVYKNLPETQQGYNKAIDDFNSNLPSLQAELVEEIRKKFIGNTQRSDYFTDAHNDGYEHAINDIITLLTK